MVQVGPVACYSTELYKNFSFLLNREEFFLNLFEEIPDRPLRMDSVLQSGERESSPFSSGEYFSSEELVLSGNWSR